MLYISPLKRRLRLFTFSMTWVCWVPEEDKQGRENNFGIEQRSKIVPHESAKWSINRDPEKKVLLP